MTALFFPHRRTPHTHTPHTQATFKVTKADDAVNAYYIQCEGIGFVNPHFQTTPPVVATAPAPTSASVPSSAHPANEEEEEEAME
jgi:hypothetical protein